MGCSVVSRTVGRVNRELGNLHRILGVPTRRITRLYRVDLRRCLGVRSKRTSPSMCQLSGVSGECNVSLSILLFKRRPHVGKCCMAHGKRKPRVSHGGRCGCRDLTMKFGSEGIGPFVMRISPLPNSGGPGGGKRSKRRCSCIVRKRLRIAVRRGIVMLGPNSDVCFSDGGSRYFHSLGGRPTGFLYVVV